VDEVIYVITGRGEGEENGRIFKIEPGTIIYAPAGAKHDCRNFSDEIIQMLCVYIPALPNEVVKKITKNAKLRVKKI
jgi:mannose-6-phosphate isomerase-like protein (cupin superfamily)